MVVAIDQQLCILLQMLGRTNNARVYCIDCAVGTKNNKSFKISLSSGWLYLHYDAGKLAGSNSKDRLKCSSKAVSPPAPLAGRSLGAVEGHLTCRSDSGGSRLEDPVNASDTRRP